MRVLAVTLMPRYQVKHPAVRNLPEVGQVANQTQWFPRAMRSIFEQQWDGVLEHYMLNGEDLTGTRYDRVTAKYEQARQMCLDGGYDAMWTAEYDMVMPRDALTKLAAVDADIVYGLYAWRWRPHWWNAYVYMDEEAGVSLSQMPKRARDAWGQQVEVVGVGHGCTLIRRHVLETVSFHRDGQACADWYMALDAREKGFRQVCDTSIVCGHMSLTPRPQTVWPDGEAKELVRIEVDA